MQKPSPRGAQPRVPGSLVSQPPSAEPRFPISSGVAR